MRDPEVLKSVPTSTAERCQLTVQEEPLMLSLPQACTLHPLRYVATFLTGCYLAVPLPGRQHNALLQGLVRPFHAALIDPY